MVFGGQRQMLLQYFHFVNRCMNGCVCRPRRRTVNWPSVPAAILFPLGSKPSPTRATRLSGVSAPGPRFDLRLRVSSTSLLNDSTFKSFSAPLQQCSASCGKGTRMRYVSCRDNQGGVADESACAHLPKPPAREMCSVVACGQWKVLEWTAVREPPHRRPEFTPEPEKNQLQTGKHEVPSI